MTLKTADRVYETSTTTGTGTYTLLGAPTGFQAFSVMGANNDCPYFATDDTNWEVGIGTVLTAPARLQRVTILASSNGGSPVDWAAGTRKIRCGLPAAMGAQRTLSKSVAGSSNVTLTQDEQSRDILVFTGALTGNIDVIVDATQREWTVYNNTSGAFTLTFKVSGGTGKAVTQGKSTKLRSDGTNIVDSITSLTALAVDGALTVGGTLSPAGLVDISGAAAGQIKFPATQNASSNANTLDDYEEGTFTPTFTIGGSSVGITYANQAGEYVKIGLAVKYNAFVQLTARGGLTGGIVMAGLPFVSKNTAASEVPPAILASNLAAGVPDIRGLINKNGATVALYKYTAAAGTLGTLSGNADCTDGTYIYAGGWYPASA